MSTEEYGRSAIAESRNPYTCGLTGKTRDASEVIAREDYLARGIGQALKFDPQHGSEWDKVVGVYSFNTVCPIISNRRIASLTLSFRLTISLSPTRSIGSTV